MTDIQKEYCEEKGLIYIKPENTEIADYVNWLEAQIKALRIHDVSGRSEQLKALLEKLLENNMCSHAGDELIEEALKGF
jgi:hypothetical protein